MDWRGGRAVEGARLESVYTGNRIAGSNPALSANQLKNSFSTRDLGGKTSLIPKDMTEGRELAALLAEPNSPSEA